ncbi:MAG: hypothetical protein V7739_07785 [Motiliproteus sp.]
MTQFLKIAFVVLSVCYPFMVYWGLQHYDAKMLLPFLLILLGLRWCFGKGVSEQKVVVAIVIGLMLVVFFWGGQLGLKLYPVLVNASFLFLFVSSLVYPPSIVERLARLRSPEMSQDAVSYTEKVTRIWSLFFLLNGSIAASTAIWATDEQWMLYNGFIAYLLMGTLAGGEWIVRQRLMRR